jgi:anti-sigma-K factor RskA
MQYRNKPELIDRLAAEYVLGTLSGGARRRFARWMRDDAALRLTVSSWEARLTPMAIAVRDVAAPKSLWPKIAARIEPTAAAKPKETSLWNSLAFWRGFGLSAAGATAALAVFIGMRPPQIVERVQVVEKSVEKPMRVSDGKNPWQPSYVATLNDAKGETMLMVYIGRKSDELWIKYEGKAMPADASLELWGLDMAGKPKSLGLIKTNGRSTIKLPDMAENTITHYKQLAVSMEPMGGSSTGQPTGPVMYKGNCHTFW